MRGEKPVPTLLPLELSTLLLAFVLLHNDQDDDDDGDGSSWLPSSTLAVVLCLQDDCGDGAVLSNIFGRQ